MWSGGPLHRVLKSLYATFFDQSERFRQFRRNIADITAATVVVVAVGTPLVFLFERQSSGSEITNVGDSLFWTIAQVLTVSSAMPAPLTTGGRVVDVILMAYGVVMIGAVVAVFNRVLVRAGDEDRSDR